MTPAEMVRAECANWVSGACIWRGDCLVADGHRCSYFEKNVLPLGTKTDLADYASLAQARKAYLTTHLPDAPHETKGTRYCQCGELLPKRRRLCDNCRREKRRADNRKHMRKKRLPRGQLTITDGQDTPQKSPSVDTNRD